MTLILHPMKMHALVIPPFLESFQLPLNGIWWRFKMSMAIIWLFSIIRISRPITRLVEFFCLVIFIIPVGAVLALHP
ncbi:MAG: hypothetical protein A2V67_00325 [Deltaproteobacteria bacterium RBG_13_61_14]|nr:MAG: hypothetical protein A2V67_00325 [Deltaproteobacteria bacterium RBG_13_61_14]